MRHMNVTSALDLKLIPKTHNEHITLLKLSYVYPRPLFIIDHI